MNRALISGSYLALIATQLLWHAVLPAPAGSGNAWLALGLALPLLLPLKGVLAGSLRSMTWAGYLALLYLVIGVMEAWANPAQRWPALAQIALVVVFVGAVLAFSRRVPPGG